MTLKELSIDHPYHPYVGNYYSNDCVEEFDTVPDFLNEYAADDLDIDYNLFIRWDINLINEKAGHKDGNYHVIITCINQRKGIHRSILIHRIFEIDAESFVECIKPHFEYIKKLWMPLS